MSKWFQLSIRDSRELRIGMATLVMIILGAVGTWLLSSSHAATASLSTEPENGAVNSGATIQTDSAASGGKAVAFASDPIQSTAMHTYFGSTHDHTGCCNNHGADNSTAQQTFATAKANGFDFMISTEHSGSTGPASVPMDPKVFYADVKKQAATYTDSTFVGLAGYEFSDNDGGPGIGKGHMTGVETDDFVSADGQNSNAQTFEDYLVAQHNAGRPAFGGFNHPDASGHPGSVPALLTPARRNVIVMTEIHNSYESGADQTHYQSMVVELDRGWRVAPTCGLDGHGLFRLQDKTEPGPCRVGVLAPSLTKANIIDAFMNRRIFSSRNLNLNIQYKVNGQWMGSIIGKPASLNFDINVTDPDTNKPNNAIKKIDIVTEGGAVVTSQTFSSYNVHWQLSLPANNKKYYFIRVYNGERTTFTAAAAPVWLE
jgi:hypothetical protein